MPSQGRFGLPKGKKKTKPAPSHRECDNPDPTLILEGQRIRKPSAAATRATESADMCAVKQHRGLEDIEEEFVDGSSVFTADSVTIAPSPEPTAHTVIKKGAAVKPKKTNMQGKKEEENALLKKNIRFRIPFNDSSAQELVMFANISIDDSVQQVKDGIYVIIGCDTVHEKSLPSLCYHLSKDAKAFKYPLNTEEAWTTLKDEWAIEVDKKGSASVANILLPTDFLKNLAVAKKHKKGKKLTKSKMGGRAPPTRIIFESDSDTLGSTAGKQDEGQYDPVYENLRDDLLVKLNKCRVCGPKEKLCLLDKHGQHRVISLEMVRAWVSAMVRLFFYVHICADRLLDSALAYQMCQLRRHRSQQRSQTSTIVTGSTKTRKDRRYIPAVLDASVPVHPCAQPRAVYLPSGGATSSPDYHHSGKRTHSPLLPADKLPSVGEWLTSLQTKSGAERRDFPAIRAKFDAHDFLTMDLADLAALPRSDYGANGFQFNLAEISFLTKWLESCMNGYASSLVTSPKRAKHH
ncbi:hypothetical protein JB92DRAFT_3105801 [Gautieria morchelliformis]|nr:hypothetical protein JB92DRAFT_3105801 [Gautieria morchelliformis]